ncbi:MAG: hypothetical protein LUE20_03275 [Oscillospiraceae bacterium]|nr:hypothetical protein [Oscillospiraceae bacterium]
MYRYFSFCLTLLLDRGCDYFRILTEDYYLEVVADAILDFGGFELLYL